MDLKDKLKGYFVGGEDTYPSVQITEEMRDDINDELDTLDDGQGGPLLLVRPSKENESIQASKKLLETFHDPRIKKMGFGPFSFIRTDAPVHSHEIWYNDGLMQFFLRPETQVDSNQFTRQIRKNYPDAQIQEMDKKFLDFEIGDYVSVATMQLNRDFYFPLRAGLCSEDVIEDDPYGGITSDMVVEEDITRDGTRVEAKDSRTMVQVTFEPARDVWTAGRPYGMDVSDISMGLKEGEIKGNMIQGFEQRSPSQRKKHTAKMLNELPGKKGFYMTIRIISISPYQEIAQRRCYTVAEDYEQHYRSISNQKLIPNPADEADIHDILVDAAARTHEYDFKDKISGNKIIQPVEAVSAVAHLPNEDIETPVIDFAKQDTGPGTPSAGMQIEEEKERQETEIDGDEKVEVLNPDDSHRAENDTTPTNNQPSTNTPKATEKSSEENDNGLGASIDEFEANENTSQTPPEGANEEKNTNKDTDSNEGNTEPTPGSTTQKQQNSDESETDVSKPTWSNVSEDEMTTEDEWESYNSDGGDNKQQTDDSDEEEDKQGWSSTGRR